MKANYGLVKSPSVTKYHAVQINTTSFPAIEAPAIGVQLGDLLLTDGVAADGGAAAVHIHETRVEAHGDGVVVRRMRPGPRSRVTARLCQGERLVRTSTSNPANPRLGWVSTEALGFATTTDLDLSFGTASPYLVWRPDP